MQKPLVVLAAILFSFCAASHAQNAPPGFPTALIDLVKNPHVTALREAGLNVGMSRSLEKTCALREKDVFGGLQQFLINAGVTYTASSDAPTVSAVVFGLPIDSQSCAVSIQIQVEVVARTVSTSTPSNVVFAPVWGSRTILLVQKVEAAQKVAAWVGGEGAALALQRPKQ